MKNSRVCCLTSVAAAGLLFIAAPDAKAAVVQPAPATARIWVYRTFEPSLSRGLAAISIDGRSLSLSPNGSAVPVDVPAGQSQIWVNNSAQAPKSKTVTLAPGQAVFAKVVVSDTWLGNDGGQGQHRPSFDIKLEPPAAATAQIARLPRG